MMYTGNHVVQARLFTSIHCLQTLSISLEELADYVASTVPFAGPEWLAAGEDMLALMWYSACVL